MTSIINPSSYWANFPTTYRGEQVAILMRWLAAGESGMVVGGSGTGKSNLAGFLSSRPDAIAAHVSNPDIYCFLHVDVNSLPQLTASFLYRGMAQALQDASEFMGSDIQQAMQQIAQSQINWDDTFAVRTTLQKMHRLMINQGGKRLVWLLDRFDEACRRLDAQTLSSLRSLRDQFKGQLCYLIFTRHPLARLRNPSEIDEFHEIVARNTCWIGPIVERDARWIARQMAERLNTSFTEPAIKQLIAVTGGLPAFMKLTCLALAEEAINSAQSNETWIKQLLTRLEFQRNCQEIWDDLTGEEQNTLIALSTGANEIMLDPEVTHYLVQSGLLVRSAPNTEVKIFSPILAAFVIQQLGTTTGIIELHPKTRAVFRGGIPLSVELTSSEDRLLAHLLEHPGEVCSKDTLIQAVWPGERVVEGIRDDRLAQLVKRLREKVEPDPTHPVYIQNVHGRGYRFVQPGT